jgi:hypothetical protein
MRNFTQPTITEVGIVTVRGQDFHTQRITYGTLQHIHVFRKGALHRHGLVFTTQREYDHWRSHLGAQRELF